MGADYSRFYLRPYLINVALLVKDAKKSYSIVISETNSINFLRNNLPKASLENPNNTDELRLYNNTLKNHQSMRRIALLSFASTCGIISSILWPHIDESKYNKNNRKISNLDTRKKERKEHLKDLFPKSCFPHLKKHFRNFLMHADNEMDEYSIDTKHHNIAFNTEYTLLDEKGTFWINIHPSTYVVSYYSKGSYKNVDIKLMYRDILKLPSLIPKVLDSVMCARIDWHYEMVRTIIEEE
jgi:hypothetical protein